MRYLSTLITDFQPVWFISIMGTGISTAVLYNFPYEAHWLRVLSIAMFSICCFCLGCATVLFILKVIYDELRAQILVDTNINVFLGCYAMGYTSWVTALDLLTDGRYPVAMYTLWWIGVAASLFTGWGVLFMLVKSSSLAIHEINSTLLLSVVPLTVVASQAQVVLPNLPQHLHLSTMVISFLLWSNAMGLSFIITTIYFHRLMFHKLPAKGPIFTSFIPIGFLGQGAFCIQYLGLNYHNYLIDSSSDNLIEAMTVKTLGVITGLALQSIGYFFTFFAVASVLSYKTHSFHHGFWAMTFPLGTMSLAAIKTYEATNWTTFRVISAIYGVALIVITVCCILGSVYLLLRSARFENDEPRNTSMDDKLDQETV